MFIYISSSYYPFINEKNLAKRDKTKRENIKKANEIAVAIAKKGHIPFVPHSMVYGLEGINEISQELTKQICYKWLEKCDAMFFIKLSADVQSEEERQFALKQNLLIYYDLNDIPKVTSDSPQKLSSEAFKAYLTEYQQCMENFRQTYAAIWQAGAIFAAISAAIIAFASSANAGIFPSRIPPLIQVLAPLPVLFWYLGIFRPLNRYCELHNDRAVQIEVLLSNSVQGLHMRHFQAFTHFRKGEGLIKRVIKFKWLTKPRVSEIVTLLGIILVIFEVYLLWIYYISRFIMI